MPKYSKEDLTKWKSEIHAVPIIARRVNVRRENDEWVGLCPFHEEKTPSFKVWKGDDGVWLYNCFGCGAQGNVFQFVERFDKVPFGRAVEIVREEAGDAEAMSVDTPAEPKKIITFTMAQYAQCERAFESSAEGKAWIEARGITMETARIFHLGFVQDATAVCGTDHPWRSEGWVTIPDIAADGKIVRSIKYRSLVAKKQMVGDKRVSGILRAQNTATFLYNLREVSGLEYIGDVVLVEGEPDTWVISQQTGMTVVGLPNVQYKLTEADLAVIGQAKHLFLAGDNDKEGAKKMDALWRQFSEAGIPAYKIQWPEGCKDANDALHQLGDRQFCIAFDQAKLAAIKRGVWQNPTKKDAKKESAAKPLAEMVAVTGDKITMKKIKWLWPKRVPANKITLFAGNPDNGKSLVSLDLAARVTTGVDFPDSANSLIPSEVLLLLAEDDPDDTVVARLLAARADITKVHFPQGIVRSDGNKDSEPQLDIDLPVLDDYLEKNPNIRLIVIDPISSFLGDVNMISDQDVRRVLTPLKRLTARRNVAVVLIMHLNKKNELDAISRVGGAMAFIGVARSSWMFIRDASSEDDVVKDSFSMCRIKGNLTAASAGGLAYHTQVVSITVPGEEEPEWTPYVVWGAAVTQSADAALEKKREHKSKHEGPGRPEGGDNTKLAQAKHFLAEKLANGPVDGEDLKADAAGLVDTISKPTLRRAAKEMKIEAPRVGKRYMWALPQMNATAAAIEAAEAQDERAGAEAISPADEAAPVEREFDYK